MLQLDIADGNNNSTIQGNFTLCMLYRTPTPDVGRFDVYDFATRCVTLYLYCGPVLRRSCSDPDYAIESFEPRFIPTWTMTSISGQSMFALTNCSPSFATPNVYLT